jgi:hypothetical protein
MNITLSNAKELWLYNAIVAHGYKLNSNNEIVKD